MLLSEETLGGMKEQIKQGNTKTIQVIIKIRYPETPIECLSNPFPHRTSTSPSGNMAIEKTFVTSRGVFHLPQRLEIWSLEWRHIRVDGALVVSGLKQDGCC